MLNHQILKIWFKEDLIKSNAQTARNSEENKLYNFATQNRLLFSKQSMQKLFQLIEIFNAFA